MFSYANTTKGTVLAQITGTDQDEEGNNVGNISYSIEDPNGSYFEGKTLQLRNEHFQIDIKVC